MDKVKKKASIFLCISICLMLVSAIVCSLVQTSGGKVNMRELTIETDSGYAMSAYLFVPDTATIENPAPAIVTSHGYLNNKEMQDANYVELARRGYVVLAIDQPSHGDSDIPSWPLWSNVDGVYQGAAAVSRMPFVDAGRIGITGHSMGGMSSNAAIAQDNLNEEPIIAAVLLNSADATYTDADGNYTDVYGSRDAAVLACVYDEFFHGYVDDSGVTHAAPGFMENPGAQSFLNFGADPASGIETRAAGTMYKMDVDGQEAIRVIYRPNIIHPWSHFSATSTSMVIDFFDSALGAPNPIPSGNQVWQWKEAFNLVGLIGFVIFICSFGTLLLYTPVFASLRASEVVAPIKVADRKGKIWFWGSLIAGALFSFLIYRWILNIGTGMTTPQTETMGLGLWAALNGVFGIISMVTYYFAYGKKNGFDLADRGVKIGLKKLGKTALLAVIIATVAYGCVFLADYFFYADFRIWTLAIKAFEAPILKYLPYGLLFMVFYVVSSVSSNAFNYNDIGGKKSWVNTIIVSLFVALPAIVMLCMQYFTYFGTKNMLWPADAMHVLWLFPIVLILFTSTVVSRILYKVTKNPYLAGIVNGIIITILTITNTCTTL